MLVTNEQIPKEVQLVVHELRMNGMRAKDIAAAIINAWPGMRVSPIWGFNRPAHDGEIILPLAITQETKDE